MGAQADEYRILKKIGKNTKNTFVFMEYIDLGLPSGTLWAEQNETDNGGYFTYDEAVAKFGDCLPTKEDFEELLEHCWKRWDNERKGLEFMGNNGAKLFLSAAGYRLSPEVFNVQNCGYYWSATPYNSFSAYYLNFHSGGEGLDHYYRYGGQSVRLIKRGGTK